MNKHESKGHGQGLPAEQEKVDPNAKPLMVHDFGDDEGAGMENVGKDEQKMSWLTALHPNAGPVKESSTRYIAAARPGMFYDKATGALYDGKKGIEFVPFHREHNYVEFVPINLGGGFLGAYDPKDPAIQQLIKKKEDALIKAGKSPKGARFGKLSTATRFSDDGLPQDGTEFTETFYLFVLALPEGGRPFPAIVPFKSQQIGKYQEFISKYLRISYPGAVNPATGIAKQINPPLWAHRWRMTTIPEKYKKGDGYGLVIRLAELNPDGTEKDKEASLMDKNDPRYVAARDLWKDFATGGRKADFSNAADGDEQPQGGAAQDTDEEIPM